MLLMMRMMMITHLYNEIERSSVHLTVHLTWGSTPSNLPSVWLKRLSAARTPCPPPGALCWHKDWLAPPPKSYLMDSKKSGQFLSRADFLYCSRKTELGRCLNHTSLRCVDVLHVGYGRRLCPMGQSSGIKWNKCCGNSEATTRPLTSQAATVCTNISRGEASTADILPLGDIMAGG